MSHLSQSLSISSGKQSRWGMKNVTVEANRGGGGGVMFTYALARGICLSLFKDDLSLRIHVSCSLRIGKC